MPTIISPYALAATYPTHGELTAWARVQEYHRVHDYCQNHPQKKSQAVATALDLPRSRIRPWVESGGKPEAVKAIQTARDLGWLNVDVDTTHGRAWARLVAWIYAGGSISRTYEPTFFARENQHTGRLSKPEVDVVANALHEIGVDHQFRERGDVYQGDRQPTGKRPTEISPASHRTLLGRCLAAAEAPVGEKNTTHPESLPSWLTNSTLETQRVFARIYLLTRASAREHEPRFVIREQRPDAYHKELVDLLERLAGEEAISRSGHNIFIRSDGAEAILSTPPVNPRSNP